MLIISRKAGQRFIIADNIEIVILEIDRSRIRFGIKAPRSVEVKTKEGTHRDQQQQSKTMSTKKGNS